MQRRSFLKALVGIPAVLVAGKLVNSEYVAQPVMDEFAGLDVPTEIKNNLEKAFQQIVHDKPITFKRFLSSDSERKRKMEILAHAKPIGILGKIG